MTVKLRLCTNGTMQGRWDLAARFPRFPGVEFQGRKIVKNSPLVDAYRTETAHDEGTDFGQVLVLTQVVPLP